MMQGYNSFRAKLITLLEQPIEDGVTHPAERVIEEALLVNQWHCFAWLARALEEHQQARPPIAASIIRCIGRLNRYRVGTWGMHIIEDALRHKDVELREAGVRALEHWGGRVAFCVLCDHIRNSCDEEPWFREYIRQVIADAEAVLSKGGTLRPIGGGAC